MHHEIQRHSSMHDQIRFMGCAVIHAGMVEHISCLKIGNNKCLQGCLHTLLCFHGMNTSRLVKLTTTVDYRWYHHVSHWVAWGT